MDQTTAPPPPPAASRRRALWIFLLFASFSFLWLVQGTLLPRLVHFALPRLAASAGYRLEFAQARARFFRPVTLDRVILSDGRGTDLRATQVEFALAGLMELFRQPRRWVERVTVRDLSGSIAPAAVTARGSSPPPAAPRGSASALLPSWPAIIDAQVDRLHLAPGPLQFVLKDAQLLLSEREVGSLRVGELTAFTGEWKKTLTDLRGTTAWRDAVAYLSDLALAPDAVIDSLSVDLDGGTGSNLVLRAFGGYLYADWAGGVQMRGAINASGLSLDAAGKFAALPDELRGRLGLLKLTFNGDPADPWSAQSSLRLEVADFAWRKRTFSDLRLGASFSGRHLEIDECNLVQKSNRLQCAGSVQIPETQADWRALSLALDLHLEARDVHALTELAGRPWNKLSGGLELDGKISGRLGEPTGWLRARGWDLLAPGLPPSSLQADMVMEGGLLKISDIESHSGPNFLRGSGEVALKEPLSYRGRLEARVREVSRYLEPLGRFAPDWAREGGLLLFWDGDGTDHSHSGVVSLELVRFTGDLNPVPLNGKFAATYSPGNVYVSRFLLDRGPLSLSASCYLSDKGLSVQDVQLFNGDARLLRSEIFLPVSLTRALEGKPWSQAMLPGGEIYATIRSEDLRLGPLANLFGQAAPCEGLVDWKLDASGPWENPAMQSVMSIDGFKARFENFSIPSSRLEATKTLAGKRLETKATLKTGSEETIRLTASVPLLSRSDEGGWHLLDRAQSVQGELALSFADLAKFSAAEPLAGKLSGSLQLSGTLAAPQLQGGFDLQAAQLLLLAGLTPATDLSGRLLFEESSAHFDGVHGKLGDGSFTLEGRAEFRDPSKIASSFEFSGTGLQFFRSDKILLTGDARLTGRGENGAGAVQGEVALRDSAADVALAATPLLLPAAPATTTSFSLTSPLRVGGWLSAWEANVRVFSSATVKIGSDGAAAVDLYLSGPLREPLLVGTVDLAGLPVALPFGPLPLSRAKVHFTRELPWTPILDLEGSAQLRGYQVRMVAWGPVGEQYLQLTSVPELSAPQIVLLLGADVSPEHDERTAAFPSAPVTEPAELPAPRIGYSWHWQ